MTDYTAEITRLQRARLDMQTAKETARITVKNRYAERIAAEIEYETNEAEKEFARLLKEAHERGVPSTLLRSEVLRTNVWSRWTYWRDRAGITPDRVVQEDRRKAEALAALPFRWEENPAAYYGYDFVLLKGPKGEDYPMRSDEPVFKEDRTWVAAPETGELREAWLSALNNYPGGKDTLQKHINTLAHSGRNEIGF